MDYQFETTSEAIRPEHTPRVRQLLEEAIRLELNSVSSEDEMKSILELHLTIEKSGVYLLLSAEGIKTVTDFVSNHLSVRRFLLGLSERFMVNLHLALFDSNLSPKMVPVTVVQGFVGQIIAMLLEIRHLQYKPGLGGKSQSLLLDEIRASLTADKLDEILKANNFLTVYYLAEITGAMANVIADFANQEPTR